MLERIKNLIKRNRILYGLGMLIKYRNDNEYYNKILNKTANNFSLISTNLCKDDKTYYLIEIKDDKVAGFFALYRMVLSSIVLADNMGWIPFVNIEGSLYNVPGGYKGKENLFEYYFNQTCDIEYGDLAQKNVVRFERKHSKLVDNSFFGDNYSIVNGYVINEDYLNEMARCSRKYIKLEDTLEKEITKEIYALLGNKKTIGVHIRGTDYNQVNEGHPIPITVIEYIKFIDDALEKGFAQIFLACDEKRTCEYMIERYKDKLVFYKDVFRSETTESIHSQIDNQKHDGFSIGREVLRDMLTLAECDGIISGLSQVSICSRIQKKASKKSFEYDEIIDNGTYKG